MISFLHNAIYFSTIFLFGSIGETLTEKSGHLNLGVPGTMCLGALGGVVGVRIYVKSIAITGQIQAFPVILIAILFAMLFAALAGLFYSFFTVSLRCNQNVIGLTLTTFGVGLANFIGGNVDQTRFSDVSKCFHLSFVNDLNPNAFESLFLTYGTLFYLAIALAVIAALILRHTRTGLSLRAVGENPATADAAGVNVTAYRYITTIIGSAIVGLGGLFYIMDYIGGSWQYAIEGFAWIAVALVIFTLWQPDLGILGAFIFGALYIMPNYITVPTKASYVKKLIAMAPYVMTIIVLIATSIVGSKKTQPPASLGVNYFREER